MPIKVDQDILGLEVSIKHFLRVQVFDTEKDLGKIEPCNVLRKAAKTRKVEEEFASWAEI